MLTKISKTLVSMRSSPGVAIYQPGNRERGGFGSRSEMFFWLSFGNVGLASLNMHLSQSPDGRIFTRMCGRGEGRTPCLPLFDSCEGLL